MLPRTRLWSALLATMLAATTLFSPLIASGQTSEFEGIPFENPSVVLEAEATPVASPVAGATPEAARSRHGALLGDPDAPVTMQIYADYQCPHCRNFHSTIEPRLIEDYVRTGKVRLELIDFPIIGVGSLDELIDDTKESVQAAEATMCAGEQDAYMRYRESLYEGELRPNSGALSDDNLIAAATDLGLDGESFSACLESGRYEKAVITAMLAGIDKGVKGTPTMMVNGDILKPGTYAELQELLDQAIEDAR